MPPTTASRASRSKNGMTKVAEPLPNQFVPKNLLEFTHYHLEQAMSTEEKRQRYLQLAKFIRSTLITLTVLMLVSCLIFGAGVAIAGLLFGLPPMTAVGIGAGGTATFALAVGASYRTYLMWILKAVPRLLAGRGRVAPGEDPQKRA